MSSYEQIAKQAEQDLGTEQNLTGKNRHEGLAEAGVNSYAEKKFADHGAELLTGDELSTNAGFNKRIPPSEGGVLDDRGRQTRGQHFEGKGGPLDKLEERDGGKNDNDVVPANVPKVDGLGSADDIATKGQAAATANVGRRAPGTGGSQYNGSDLYNPESVPDSISAEGNVAPASVVEASREAEQPEKFGPV
ncbi:uncharacterized protein J7T54_001411 [Emericellopsis cladophorae]|uniref:Uncharacterized protein n=1 Tax=Emericellopsis cladophorae TaxID=2686198 RepID=A0A9P9Y0S9_9HYPO|nr:uncharacterized protein J7T54_001411 [Emericellopsis cladophorae]KAI6781449.1 hypothetical protein J7T54_001411 [Emericellopsis cladophorae]